MARPTSQADQEQIRWLEDSKERVARAGYLMNRATDKGQDAVSEAIKNAEHMISELRTSKLSPQNYYDLYITVTDHLRDLSDFFERLEEGSGSFSILKMYETAQHTDKIIPRLYLLITVAGVFIKSGKAAAKDILFDLVELCRGVQHPMRGLFLRHYLSQMSRDKLPDEGSPQEGDVKDSIEFILQNFGEMNKLWVRMQHQGAFRTMSRREMERKNLRQLVGTNLVRLSGMRGVNLTTYKAIVLPRILEQVVNCKDVIAQEYLMDCIIQVFPDDFHLGTLETFLTTCSQLQDNVKVKDILIVLMNRLANFARDEPEMVPSDIEMFPLFHRYSSQIIESKNDMELCDILDLQVALVNFASRCYPDRLQYLNHVHEFACQRIEACDPATKEDSMKRAVPQIVDLLSLPLETISLRILELTHYASLLASLVDEDRKRVAVAITVNAAKSATPITTVEEADSLFQYLSPLIVKECKVDDSNRFEFEQEQHAVAQLFQLIQSDSIDVHFEMYNVARRHFGRGGVHRILFTLPPLVLNSLQLAEKACEQNEAKRAKHIFGFVHETIGALREARPTGYPELALRLFLVAGQSASKCGFEAIAYEFVAQSISTYEDHITDSKQQYAAVVYMAGALQRMTGFSADNYDTLISKCTQHSAKLMKKVDGCRAVYMCSHLFWAGSDEDPVHRDEGKVLACLKRSLKIANSCMGKQVPMFVEIFNKYLYFFERECPSITAKYLRGLVELIREHMRLAEAQAATSPEAMEAFVRCARHYENTIKHIKHKMAGEDGERYMAILPGVTEPAAPDTPAETAETAE